MVTFPKLKCPKIAFINRFSHGLQGICIFFLCAPALRCVVTRRSIGIGYEDATYRLSKGKGNHGDPTTHARNVCHIYIVWAQAGVEGCVVRI